MGYKIEYQSFVDYFPIFRGGFQKKLEHASIKSACRGRHDIVMMAFHHSTSDLCMKISTEERIEILKKLRHIAILLYGWIRLIVLELVCSM